MRHLAALTLLLLSGLPAPAMCKNKRFDFAHFGQNQTVCFFPKMEKTNGLFWHVQDKKKNPPDPKVWMCLKGPILWEEGFSNGAWSKEWSRYKGNYVVEKDQLKVAQVAGDGHLPTMTRNFKESNVVIQFAFKFEGAKWLGIQLDDTTNDDKKEHVAQLTVEPDGFRIEKMTGFGPTTRNRVLDQKKVKFAPGTWHTIVWEIQGDEMVATVDDKEMVLTKAEGMTLARTRLQLVSAGEWAWYDAIKVWKAAPHPDWPKRRVVLMQAKK